MSKQKIEDYYSAHSSTIFSEMLGKDENYQRLKKSQKSSRGSLAECHQPRSMEAIPCLR